MGYLTLSYLEKLKTSPQLQELEWYRCKNDPEHFIFNWCKTLDEHELSEEVIKQVPRKEYVKVLIKYWCENKVIAIPKSRQIMGSWITVILFLHLAIFNKGKKVFFQSKKKEDANDLVKRAYIVYTHLPSFLKRYYEGGKFINVIQNPKVKGKEVENKLIFPAINSEIRGIPEGADKVRSHTLSGLLMDEAAFQPEASGAYRAARPTISGGGRLTLLSSAEADTFFEKIVFDQLDMQDDV